MPKDRTVKDLENLYTQARSARKILEPDWYMNLAYYANKQWMAWDGRRLYQPTLRKNRITIVENRITGCVRTELAKMTKNRPVFTVTPNTGDEMDSNAAQLAEQIMRYQWKHLHLHEKTYEALEWSRICGAGFLKVYWDSTVGNPIEIMVNQDGSLLQDGQGSVVKSGSDHALMAVQMALQAGVPGPRHKTVAQGDICVEARSPFQIFVDPLASQFSEAEWLIEESVKSEEWVQKRYGVDLKPDTAANPGMVEARIGGAFTPGTGGYKGVKIREYWCKPCSEYPDGCRKVWAQGKILDEDSQPFDPMPYVMLSGIPIPGRLWPMSVVDLLRGPQTELNKTLSQMAENRNRVGNPTVVASKQAIQDPEKFTDGTMMPGGVVWIDDIGSPNAVPQFLQAPGLPEYVVQSVEMNMQAIEDLSGQHEVTNANVPPGVTAASAITLLQEADDTRLGPAITDYEINLGRFGKKILELVEEFYTDSRTIKLGGDNGAWQIFDFRGAMLRGNTSVEVQAGSAFPQSKAAKQAMIQDLMTFFVQSGNPPHGKQLSQFLQDTGMGASDRLIQQFSIDESQINRENILLAQGMPLPINDYDNDQAHIDGHQDFEKAARFQQLDPQIQAIHLQHVQEHRARLDQVQQNAQMMQAQANGQPSPQDAQMMQALEAQGQAQQIQGQAAQQQQQLQGQQQQQADQAQQAQLQQAGTAQQQGYQAASQEQQQRQAEEAHRQKMQHAQELHNARLRQMAQQAKQQPRGAQNK